MAALEADAEERAKRAQISTCTPQPNGWSRRFFLCGAPPSCSSPSITIKGWLLLCGLQRVEERKLLAGGRPPEESLSRRMDSRQTPL